MTLSTPDSKMASQWRLMLRSVSSPVKLGRPAPFCCARSFTAYPLSRRATYSTGDSTQISLTTEYV